MNKTLLAGIILVFPTVMAAQSAIDAFSISQSDLRGSARFMSMGGAFTALGGDISTLNQNPAGIGVFRSSDISVTLDINAMNTKTNALGGAESMSKTKFNCNNFGYVGVIRLNSETMPFFNWGASYSRTASFDRHYRGNLGNLATSYTNLVADYTTRDIAAGYYSPNDLWGGDDYDPYMSSAAPWSTILMYNAYSINPVAENSGTFTGLYDYDKTSAMGSFDVEERGYIDEYSINLGGNIFNTVYWGIGFGITDIEFKQFAYYGESLHDANVSYGSSYTHGNGTLGLENYKRIYGSGFNFKAGLIFKPVNEFRLGIAVHTPTYYNLSYEGQAAAEYDFTSPDYSDGGVRGTAYTAPDEFDFKAHTPWRLMVGAAGVIGGRAIISADYEFRGYSSMKIQDWHGNDYRDINSDIETYYQGVNILRLGAEYRLTPSFSIRAGYSYESSPVKSGILDPATSEANYIYTSGPDDTETQPSYTFDRSTQYITAGLGYRYKSVYLDLAYVHRYRQSDYHAFTDYVDTDNYAVHAPSSKLTDHNNSVVLTFGVKF